MIQRLIIILSIILIDSGCFSGVKAVGKPTLTVPKHCFDFSFKFNSSEQQDGKVCFNHEHVCTHVLSKTKQYGSMAGVTNLSECGVLK
jgi:hypothetical protein